MDGIKKGIGTREKESRYSGLKLRLDQDKGNGIWEEVETFKTKPKTTQYNYIDLFSGAGGLSYGLKSAGLNKLLSNEIDPEASETTRMNFPESIHFEGPIETFSNEAFKKAIGGKKVHIVCGGPPCQGFSVAGNRDPNDPRNQLFKQFFRVVDLFQPDIVMMENVPGLVTLKGGHFFENILKEFERHGYNKPSARILEAATFGVPQLRSRVIFIASRKGPNLYPKPFLDKKNYKSIDSAIEDLIGCPMDPSINHVWTNHSKKFEKRIAEVAPGKSLYETFRDAYKRQFKGLPSMTIKENHGGTHIHYKLNRVISAREMARLQTFPDKFKFAGSHKRAYWQIGNAVPCEMAKHLGLALIEMLNRQGYKKIS